MFIIILDKIMRFINYTLLIFCAVLFGCVVPNDGNDTPIKMDNKSDTALWVKFSYFTPREYECAAGVSGECLPWESFVFDEMRYEGRPIVIKVYDLETIENNPDYRFEIGEIPIEPLIKYIFTDAQLSAHNWTFTYPPSEPWMQSGIGDN